MATERTNITQKIQVFEYMVSRLARWYVDLNKAEATPEKPLTEEAALSGFSKLKLFKLHFFVTAVTSDKEKKEDLLSIFDNFYALPYGPVESDVYNNLGYTVIYSIDNSVEKRTGNPGGKYFEGLDSQIRQQVDAAVDALRDKNEQLINYSAYDLVNLSHRWPVWMMMYNAAKIKGRNCEPMPSSLIRAGYRIYS